MQPTSPVYPLLALQAPSVNSTDPAGAATASVHRVEERPQSALAQGSYAWPAWGVLVVAALSVVGALGWWVRLQRRKSPLPGSPAGATPTSTARPVNVASANEGTRS